MIYDEIEVYFTDGSSFLIMAEDTNPLDAITNLCHKEKRNIEEVESWEIVDSYEEEEIRKEDVLLSIYDTIEEYRL